MLPRLEAKTRLVFVAAASAPRPHGSSLAVLARGIDAVEGRKRLPGTATCLAAIAVRDAVPKESQNRLPRTGAFVAVDECRATPTTTLRPARARARLPGAAWTCHPGARSGLLRRWGDFISREVPGQSPRPGGSYHDQDAGAAFQLAALSLIILALPGRCESLIPA